MPTEEQNVPDPGDVTLDINKIIASYTRQIGDQAHQIAVKDAIIGTLQEENAQLRTMIDEFGKSIEGAARPTPAPTKRTTPKKGK